MKKVIFILGAIVVLVLLAGTCSQQIRETYKNINTMQNEKQSCMGGCREPTQLYGNCSSQIEKDDNGNCYKTCPYECSDSSPYANCRYDSQCMGCGFKKFRVNCDGSINPEWGDNSVLSDNNLDKIVTPKPLQTFEDSSPQDASQSNEDMQITKDGEMNNNDLPEYEKELSKHAEARIRGNRINILIGMEYEIVSKQDLYGDGVFAFKQIISFLNPEDKNTPYLDKDPKNDLKNIIRQKK